jgi:preprotein translocase subunit SecE
LVAGSSPAARATNRIEMSQITQYFKDSYEELVTKVTWPTWRELQGSSVLVFVSSLIIAALVFVMDWVFGVNGSESIWSGVVGLIYELF